MTSLSVKQKALVFLERYKTLDSSNIYNTPWELTQDGVANALCISRAHASIVLNQLKGEEFAEEKITHIKGGKYKRKTYYITPAGMEEAARIREFASKENIDLNPMIEMKKLDYSDILKKLSDSDRYGLGCACAFCMPMPANILPPIKNIALPMNSEGEYVIDPELRKKVLENADEDDRREWHGFAANYWFDKKLKNEKDFYESLHELLYHYVESGRNRDACKLISSDLYYFIYSIDDQIRDSVEKVRPVEKYAKDVLMLKLNICLEYGDLDVTDALIEQLKAIDPDCASSFVFDIEMKKGNRDAAKTAIADTWERDPLAAVRWASLLRMDGRYQEARDVLESIKNIVGTDLADFQIQKFIELARIDSAEGRYEDAYQRISKARASIRNKGTDKRLDALEKELRAKVII